MPEPDGGWASLWALDPQVQFLNHGSFGACPRHVLDYQAQLRERLERQPVEFLGRQLPQLLDETRQSVAGHAIVPPERIVQTVEFEGVPGHVLLETATFEEHDGKTRLTAQSFEDRDGMVQAGMEDGAVETMDRLAELLRGMRNA